MLKPLRNIFRKNNNEINISLPYFMVGGNFVEGNRASNDMLDLFYSLNPNSTNDNTIANQFKFGLTAWSCINVRANILSSLGVKVINGDGTDAKSSPAQWFLDKYKKYIFLTEISLNLWGKAFFKKLYNQHGRPTDLQWVSPLDIQINYNANQDRILNYYLYDSREYATTEDIIHINLFDPLNDFDGVSPYEIAMKRINAETNLINWSSSFFYNSARPDGMLVFDGKMSEDKFQKIEKKWREFKGSRNAYKTFITAADGGWKWTPITSPPKDLAMKDFVDIVKADIASAFNVHPVLIGIGGANDALSASSTYEAVWKQHVRFVAMPRQDMIIEELNNQWLKKDFNNRYKLIPDLNDQLSDILTSEERSNIARQNYQSGVWSLTEARNYLGFSENTDGTVPPTNTGYVIELFKNGIITRNESRQLINLDGVIEDGFYNDFFGFSRPILQRSNSVESLYDVYIVLNLNSDNKINEIKNEIKNKYDVQWVDSEEYHLTLLGVVGISKEDVQLLRDKLIKILNNKLPKLNLVKINSFNNIDENSLHIEVEKSEGLIELQHDLFNGLSDLFTINQYSHPENYKPHITLAYSQNYIDVEKHKLNGYVVPKSIELTYKEDGEYNVALSINNSTDRSKDYIIDELRALKNYLKNGNDIKKFSRAYIDDYYYSILEKANEDGWGISHIYDVLLRNIKFGDDIKFGANNSDYNNYWRLLGPTGVGDTWLQYQNKINISHDDSIEDIVKKVNEYNEEIVDSWVKGPLAENLVQGINAADLILDNKRQDIELNWDLLNQDSIDFIRSYGFELIKNLNNVTIDKIKNAIEQSVTDGLTVDETAELINSILQGQIAIERSKLISETELIRAYNAGVINRWEARGVQEVIWQTVNDENVCKVCRGLHGKSANINTGFDIGTGVVKYSAHPRCRCFRKPVI